MKYKLPVEFVVEKVESGTDEEDMIVLKCLYTSEGDMSFRLTYQELNRLNTAVQLGLLEFKVNDKYRFRECNRV